MRRVLSLQDINEAKFLKKQGYTNRQIATEFGIPKTTIWENIFQTPLQKARNMERRRNRVRPGPSYKDLRVVITVTQYMRNIGYNSGEVAHSLQIPLREINYIYSKYH